MDGRVSFIPKHEWHIFVSTDSFGDNINSSQLGNHIARSFLNSRSLTINSLIEIETVWN